MKTLRHWITLSAIVAVAFGFSSCAYDPYYSSSSGYYSSGYGYGHGYGGSSFSTSLFVSTGDPRWGYDPHSYCYYDYHSRRYYDPYLYGYYPIGYRPPIVIGVPHPYGWRPGREYCPPPRTVRNVTVVNYRNREAAYRNSDYSWANQVRIGSDSRVRGQRQPHHEASPYTAPSRYDRDTRSSRSSTRVQQPSERYSPNHSRNYTQPQRRTTDEARQRGSERRSRIYNTPVTDSSPRRASFAQQRQSAERQSAPPSVQGHSRNSEYRPTPSTNRETRTENRRRGNPDDSNQQWNNERSRRSLRSLGQD